MTAPSREQFWQALPLLEELNQLALATDTAAVDDYERALSIAVGDEIIHDSPYGELVYEFLEHRPIGNRARDPEEGISQAEAAGRLRTATVADVRQYDPTFPNERYKDPAYWRRPLRAIALDPDRAGHFIFSILARSVQTNLPSRYAPVELLMQLAGNGRRDIRILDVGTSVMQGPNQLASKHLSLFRFEPVKVGDPANVRSRNRLWDQEPWLTCRTNDLLINRPSVLGQCVGIDIFSPSEERTINWAESSLRIRELADQRFMHRFRQLMREHPAKVEFMAVDLTTGLHEKEFQEAYGDKKFDMVIFSYILHQLGRSAVQKMLSKAEEYLDPGGLGMTVVSDHAYTHPTAPGIPRFHQKKWREEGKAKARVLVRYQQDPSGAFHEFARARTSRLQELQFGLGQLMVNGEFVPVPEVIKEA